MSATTLQVLDNISPKVLYGGRPYSINLDIGYGDGASTLSLKIINEQGSYNISRGDLSWKNIQTINIGGFSFKGYLVAYQEEKVANGLKTVSLEYEDCSSKLNKVFIGLHKRHGLNKQLENNNNPNNSKNVYRNIGSKIKFGLGPTDPTEYLKIVGREINPVDRLLNENPEVDIDWCNPCLTCGGGNVSDHRREEYDNLDNLDVYYTFEELLKSLNISVPSSVVGSKLYKDFNGPLGEVLQQWGSIYGFNFRWNPERSNISDAIELIDMNTPINIGKDIPNPNITTEILDGASIRNASGKGVITYYKREGGVQTYPCNDIKLYDLNCLQLADLYTSDKFKTDGVSNQPQDAYKWFELSTALSYYSSALRDCLIWFNGYGITTFEEAKKYVLTPTQIKNGYSPDGEVAKKTLSRLGNLQIAEVIDKQHPFWQNCKDSVDDIAYYEDISEKISGDRDDKYYFFIAKINEELLVTNAAIQNKLSNFMGRYWTRLGDVTTCGDSGLDSRTKTVELVTPEGSNAAFVGEDVEYSVNLPFTNFGHTKNSSIAKFVQYISDPQNKLHKETKNHDLDGGETVSVNVLTPFMWAERDPKWYPDISDTTLYQDKVDYYSKLCFCKVGEGRFEFLEAINPEFKDLGYKLFIVQESGDGNSLPVTVTRTKHFLEPNKPRRCVTNNGYNQLGVLINQKDIDAETKENPNSLSVMGNYGLMNNETVWVTFDGFYFMAPVGGCLALESTAFDDESSLSVNYQINASRGDSTYRVAALQQVEIPVAIPKIETMFRDIHSDSEISGVGSYNINFLDVSNDDLDIFKQKSCVPNEDFVKKYHEELNKNLKFLNSQPIDTYEITEAGIMVSGGLARSAGISSINIAIGNDGAYTRYAFSDRYAEIINDELLAFKVKMNNALKRKYKMANSYRQPNAFNNPLVVKTPEN